MPAPDIRPLKALIDPRWQLPDLLLVASEAAILVLIGAWIMRWAWAAAVARRRARPPAPFDGADAVRRLDALSAAAPAALEPLYAGVSTLTRQSLQSALGVPATAWSSTEIAEAVGDGRAADSPHRHLRETLTFVDAVRFGGRMPTPEETRVVVERTRTLLLRRP